MTADDGHGIDPKSGGVVLGSDGLPVREVGFWSKDKHHFLSRYVDAFTTAMKGNSAWTGLGYVDLFAGPGRCKLRDGDEEFDGSPLIALDAPEESKGFDEFVFADMSEIALEAIRSRFRARGASVSPRLFPGDCNRNIAAITEAMSPDHLHLAFLDPTGLHIDFDTVRKLTRGQCVDLIISVMDQIDLLRNIHGPYYSNPSSNLDAFLGKEVAWRKAFDGLANQDAAHVRDLILSLYRKQLRPIGYEHFGDPKRISNAGPLYLLFFASKHALGARLWNRTSDKDRGGQSTLPGILEDT